MRDTFRKTAYAGLAAGAAGIALLPALVFAVARPAAPKASSLTVLFTNQAGGQIRSCNCTKFRYGGYGRQTTLVSSLRKSIPNLLVIEGGDFLGRPDSAQDKLKADVALKAFDIIKLAAVVPGEVELRFGRESLASFQKTCKSAFVLANVRDKASGKQVCGKSYVAHKTAGGLKVAVVGLLGPKMLPKELPLGETDFKVTDHVAALKQVLPKARAAADVVIVVAHSTADEARPLAQVKGVDVVICTHSDEKLVMPAKDANVVDMPAQRVGGCVLVNSGVRFGWSVGRLDLELQQGKIKSHTSRLHYLDRAYDEDPKLVKLYDEYNKQVQELTVKQEQQMRKQFDEILKKRGIDPTKSRRPKVFAGSAACKDCHQAAYDTWAKSRHAKAFASLEKTKQEFDPECVSCHVTGRMVRGGFANAKETPELKDVQCEACHDPGAAHVAKPAAGYGATGEEQCRSCHTEDYNPDWDYEQMWKEVAH